MPKKSNNKGEYLIIHGKITDRDGNYVQTSYRALQDEASRQTTKQEESQGHYPI